MRAERIADNVAVKMTVIFSNGEVGAVPRDILDDSIRTRKIIAFLRSTGWVQIDRDPIRKVKRAANPEQEDGDASLGRPAAGTSSP